MQTVALVAATVTALVFIAVGIGVLFLQARVRRLLDQVGSMLESEVTPTLRAAAKTVDEAQQAVGKLDEGLSSLASSLKRVDRITATLEPDSMARTVIQPAVAKIASWLGGVRKGLASARGGRAAKKSVVEGEETETG